MPVIRINKTAYKALEAEAIKEDRSISWLVSNLVLTGIEAKNTISEEPKPEEPKKEKPKREKKVHPLFNTLKDLWFEHWKQTNLYEFQSWSGMHAKALNDIIRKIEALDKSENTEEVFKTILQKLPQFYKDKFLTTINKNFDAIISEIRKSKTGSMEEIRKHYGF